MPRLCLMKLSTWMTSNWLHYCSVSTFQAGLPKSLLIPHIRKRKFNIMLNDNRDMTPYKYTVAHFRKVDIDRLYIECMRPDHEVGRLVYMSLSIVVFHMLTLLIQTWLKTYYYLID